MLTSALPLSPPQSTLRYLRLLGAGADTENRKLFFCCYATWTAVTAPLGTYVMSSNHGALPFLRLWGQLRRLDLVEPSAVA